MLVGMEAQFGSRNEVVADTPKLIPVANQKFYLNTFFFWRGREWKCDHAVAIQIKLSIIKDMCEGQSIYTIVDVRDRQDEKM